MIVLVVIRPNIYSAHPVESLEMLYFSLKYSNFNVNKEGPNSGSK